MVIDIILASALVLAGGSHLGTYVLGRRRAERAAVLEEQICTGYPQDGSGYPMRADCQGVRSPTCSDGRCSFHCKRTCNCDHPSES